MDTARLAVCWDRRTSQQWLNDAARFARIAKRFDNHPQLSARFSRLARDAVALSRQSIADLDYFRIRAAAEKDGAAKAAHARARHAHLEMAARYQTLIHMTEAAASRDPRSL